MFVVPADVGVHGLYELLDSCGLPIGRIEHFGFQPTEEAFAWAVLRAKYQAARDDGMLDLIARARETYAEAVARAEVAADRPFLEGLIDGPEDLLSEDTFPRMEPMFAKYAEGSEMFALLEKAATVFGDARRRSPLTR